MRGVSMTEIYNEIGYIKEVLEKGLSQRWILETRLLTKYYKSQGLKKAEILSIIKKKCELYVTQYDPLVSYRIVNKEVEKAWNDKTPLREIKEVYFSKGVLDWFLNLENEEMDKELYDTLSGHYKARNIPFNKKPFNKNRVKFLFTLYVWGLIQAQYLDFPWSMDLNRYGKRIKIDANLPTSFKIIPECDLLRDLGMLDITWGGRRGRSKGVRTNRKVISKFVNLDVFKEEITKDNRMVISGEDLYNCGLWLEKQKMGSFICQSCGKEFPHYSKSATEMLRKYCKKCGVEKDKENKRELFQQSSTYERKQVVSIYCVDCGKEIIIIPGLNKTNRCEDCYREYRKKYNNEKMAILRNKK